MIAPIVRDDGTYYELDRLIEYTTLHSMDEYSFGELTLYVFFDECKDNYFLAECVRDYDDNLCERVFNVTAYHDGIRHLEFNREAGESSGYVYYPNIENLTQALKKVRELELKYCQNCD